MNAKDCIFCSIVGKKLPGFKVYEDKDHFAFLDMYPLTRGHTLVIPKKHYRWVYDVPKFEEYWGAVLKVTKQIQKTLNPEFVTYHTYGEVPHAHIHILPRYQKIQEKPAVVPKVPISISKLEMQVIANKIKAKHEI